MVTKALISVDEYLSNPRYEFSEYLEGVIVDKYPLVEGEPVVNNAHGFLVGLIVTWFNQRVYEWGVWAGTEAHTQIRPNNFRLPNISVLGLGPLEQIQRSAPLIVTEVLSPCNTMSEMLSKLEDYEHLSVPNIWIIDPVTRAGLVCRKKEMK